MAGPNNMSSNQQNVKSHQGPGIRIPSYLDKTKSAIFSTFQDLEWEQRDRLFDALKNPNTSLYRVDRSHIALSRNRYGNVQPWDQSRIKLKPPIGGSDYVNASPILLKSRGSLPDNATGSGMEKVILETRYIASQGPKQGQFSHFWHMVMQQTTGDVGAIIMLTPCYEGNKEKCAQYFPHGMADPIIELAREETGHETGALALPQAANDIENTTTATDHQSETVEHVHSWSTDTVELLSFEHDASLGCDVRELKLTIGHETKTIFHYLFKGWPDFGRPEAEDCRALIELTRRTKSIAGESPRIVHCSAGIGRTGTFIALDFLVREIEEGRLVENNRLARATDPTNAKSFAANNEATRLEPVQTWGRSGPQKINTPTSEDGPEGDDKHKDDLIYQTVSSLRDQRMMMVTTEIQLLFLYEVIKEVFLDVYQAKPEGAVVRLSEVKNDDLPKGKIPRMEGTERENASVEPDGSDAQESVSEAETEIMHAHENVEGHDNSEEVDDEPYKAVAPGHIQEVMSKTQE